MALVNSRQAKKTNDERVLKKALYRANFPLATTMAPFELFPRAARAGVVSPDCFTGVGG